MPTTTTTKICRQQRATLIGNAMAGEVIVARQFVLRIIQITLLAQGMENAKVGDANIKYVMEDSPEANTVMNIQTVFRLIVNCFGAHESPRFPRCIIISEMS